MRGTGFSTDQTYRVGYYDAMGLDGRRKVAEEGPLTATGGTLDSSYLLTTDQTADAGTWNVVAYPSSVTPSDPYSSTDPDRVADDQLNVQASAIPEFPDVLAGIGVAALSGAIYFWLKRRKERRAYAGG